MGLSYYDVCGAEYQEGFKKGYETAKSIFYKEGHWINHSYVKTHLQIDYELPSECSICHYRHGLPNSAYCPCCGAAMKGD